MILPAIPHQFTPFHTMHNHSWPFPTIPQHFPTFPTILHQFSTTPTMPNLSQTFPTIPQHFQTFPNILLQFSTTPTISDHSAAFPKTFPSILHQISTFLTIPYHSPLFTTVTDCIFGDNRLFKEYNFDFENFVRQLAHTSGNSAKIVRWLPTGSQSWLKE